MQEKDNSKSNPQPESSAPESPEYIYQLFKKTISAPNNTLTSPFEKIENKFIDLTLSLKDDLTNIQDSITNKIKQIRAQDFTYRYLSPNGEETLIKDLTNTSSTALNPMHPREAEIQALRYLRGLLLIIENSTSLKNKIRDAFIQPYHFYLQKMSAHPENAATHTHWLAEEFTKLLISDDLDMNHARRQLTMARDLGMQLESHPAICTITKNNDTLTIEKSTQIKISNTYYDKHFSSITSQPWFYSALSYAGFSKHQPDTWLEHFFKNNFDNLKKYCVPAAPSARWLPLPANNQLVENHVINQMTLESLDSSFIRMGSVAAYEIKHQSVQNAFATEQLKEIIKNQLVNSIKKFKNEYSAVIPADKLVNFDFYVDYQSLLTTHYIETALPHTDNNSKFYKMTKKAMAMLASDNELKMLAAQQGANLIFYHTNLSINKHADWISARKHSERIKDIQTAKITAMENLAANIDKDKWDAVTDKKIKYQIALRITASSYLKYMLQSIDYPSPLKHYQRHIMMAALEFLTMGDQALSLAGCKSARDRTAIFAAAVKTMQENPTAMHDWKMLSAGITKSLMQGHHFRSMSHHVATVKVNLVHSEFMFSLPASLQLNINDTKKFTNTLKKFIEPMNARHEYDVVLSKHSGMLFSTKMTNHDVALPEIKSPKP